MKLHIKESVDNSTWVNIIEQNRDKIADELIDLAKDACGRHQMDLYLDSDGNITIFDNIGGNSWINSDDCIVIWTTRGYEYETPEDLADLYTDDFIKLLNEYTSEDVNDYVTTWLYLNTDASEYYDTVEEYIESDGDEIKKELIKEFPISYKSMINDILSDIFDYNWANTVIDNKIEELERTAYESVKIRNRNKIKESANKTKFRVDVYSPSDSRHDSLITRTYVNAADKESAKQNVFDNLSSTIKNKFKIKDTSSFEATEVRS